MKKAVLYFIVPLVFISMNIAKADPSPVLLFLSKQDQVDTLGYNIVNELPVLLYSEIISGRIPLWDSPEKTIRIEPTSLKSLERSIGDEFIKCKQLFIYELWDLDKKKGDLTTVGFYFSSRTIKGDEVSYGFVEYAPLDSLFRNSFIPSNANGNCNLTYYEVLKSKYYEFHVVQVAEKKITNVKEALSLKDEVKGFVNQRTVPPGYDCKELTYTINRMGKDSLASNESSDRFISALELFFNENAEVFYNLGGDRIQDFIQANKIKISSVEITENWLKRTGMIENKFISMKIMSPVGQLGPISKPDIHALDFLVDFKSVSDFLNEKEFYFRIVKINNQEIVDAQSDAYLNGLRTWKWNQLTEFVRYE
jgi:hypothetical protein